MTNTVEATPIAARAVPRATRFPLHMPVQFRLPGDKDWRHGMIENISRSGVLFQSDVSVDARTPLEMRMALPVGLAGHVGASVYCQAQVVRILEPAGSRVRPVVAVTINEYRLIPPPKPAEREF
ncbi:MAG TPA: PilZ domain-containing protein [Candidatus Xenobia bacterium]|nr:PilZ domain-containing protein [Candidatus Xenobia bacterium]